MLKENEKLEKYTVVCCYRNIYLFFCVHDYISANHILYHVSTATKSSNLKVIYLKKNIAMLDTFYSSNIEEQNIS
jgi:hypothetical protein